MEITINLDDGGLAHDMDTEILLSELANRSIETLNEHVELLEDIRTSLYGNRVNDAIALLERLLTDVRNA